MLRFNDIHFSYTVEKTVLKGVSLELKPGEVVGIVGASGGGKSSLLRILSGHLDATFGTTFFQDKKIKGPSEQLIPGHPEIQLVNQDFALDTYHTVLENVRVKMGYLPDQIKNKFSRELLELVELSEYADTKALHLSGGEQQRLAIARALAMEPSVLLLDEPFSHLDAHLRVRIGDYLRELVKVRNIACVLVSHDGLDIMQWCNRIVFMDSGVFKRIAKPEKFYYQPKSYKEGVYFGELNRLTINGKTILFRPNEFKLVEDHGISLKLDQKFFCGTYVKYKYLSEKNIPVILYSDKELAHEISIEITFKD